MSEFFAMGGYALYVWGSYGVATIVLAGLLLLSLRGLKRNESLLAALEASVPARGGRRRKAPPVQDDGTAAMLAAATALMATGAADGGAGADGGAS